MKIKVCGMRDPQNIADLGRCQPDFTGLIFYPESKRFVGDTLSADDILQNKDQDFVGVFVDASISEVLDRVKKFNLSSIQLHGDESPEHCRQLKDNGLVVIKAIAIESAGDFLKCKDFVGAVDHFLFDTKTMMKGGSGRKFDWKVLEAYREAVPFFLSGGIGPEDVEVILDLSHPALYGVDINSGFEISPGLKDVSAVKKFISRLRGGQEKTSDARFQTSDEPGSAHAKRKTQNAQHATMQYSVSDDGFYGEFGGAFIPELLYPNVEELRQRYLEIMEEESFREEFRELLHQYVGRPTPLYFAKRLSERYGTNIYLKREDLCHTGAHKVNNTIGQILLAERLGKKRIIAETGAGQHGVATATVCALKGLPCIVYMGALDVQRQAPNVARMKMLGAEVRPVTSGSQTLKDATNEAIRDWINNPEDTHYIIGSVVGPHPYPDMVARFQSVISQEIKSQLGQSPDYIIACVGGGSNAIGAFYHFIEDPDVTLIGVEAAGEGVDTGKTAATIALGKPGVLHASMSYLIQDDDGQIVEPHSISAGLDYPGIGPVHAHLYKTGRAEYPGVTDREALEAGQLLARMEGIIPALESAHALAYLEKRKFMPEDTVVINLSGRGDKDMATYNQYLHYD